MRALLLWFLFLFGCRYQLVAPNSGLPGNVTSVFVPVFFNKTAEAHIEMAFTNSLRDELSRGGRLGGESDSAQIIGTVVSISSAPFIGAPGMPPTFMATGTVSLRLQKSDELLSMISVSGEEEYPPGPDILLTESNRAQALNRLAQKLMREAMEKLGN
jgi:hypothetical protein